MFALLAGPSAAAPLPDVSAVDARSEVRVETGVFTDQGGVALGVAGVVRRGSVFVEGAGSVGSRIQLRGVQISDQPGFGAGTLMVGFDAVLRNRVGPVAFVDTMVIHGLERDCSRFGCRYGLFVGDTSGMGAAFQPGLGLRVTGRSGRSGPPMRGVGWSFVAGAQPHVAYETLYPGVRVDAAVWDLARGWTTHLWGSRFGAGAGVGIPLGGRRT